MGLTGRAGGFYNETGACLAQSVRRERMNMLFDALNLQAVRKVGNCCMNVYPLPEYHMERTLNVHDLLYVIEGEWGVEQDGKTYALKAGDAIFLRAGSHHKGTTLSSPYMRVYYVHFDALAEDRSNVEMNMDDLYKGGEGNIAYIPTRIECGKNEVVPRLMNEMINAFYSDRPDKQRLEMFLLKELLNELAHIAQTAPPYTEEWIIQVLRLFRGDNKHMYSIKELSDMANVSMRTVSEQFKRITGQSPYQYQMNLKLDTAKMQLTASNYTIQEIAANIGFCDAYQFSKMFKKHFGMSPSMYRKSILRMNMNRKGRII